ncbi:MAG TPA: OmpA family protein [Bryobacteraceae bacterium]|nr:OmpA family protein [Bryobacteraceae bacterium]
MMDRNSRVRGLLKTTVLISAEALMTATLALSMVTPNARTFPAGEKTKVQGVIISRDGNTLKLRTEDDSIGTIDLNDATKVQLKHGIFGRKKAMDVAALVPGLTVEAQGKGDEKGDLVADRVIFDPNSMRASRQIDTVVSPIEARQGTLESKAGQLESRANQMENRQGQLETAQKQTDQQVGQVQTQVGEVKTTAQQATQGVTDVNKRVSDLDNYQVADTATVYFKINSSTLSPQAKQDLDALAQKAQSAKGYAVEVAGYADSTGKAALNQALSDRRAEAVTRYLEQQGNIPIHRILTPTGMGTSHEAAENNTPQGRKLNRRVEVKLLVNQGVVSGTSGAPAAKQPGDSVK